MTEFHRTRLFISVVLGLGLSVPGIAQGTISTYAGPPLPVNGSQAFTQAFGGPSSVIQDGSGGFYFTDAPQNRVYRVNAAGILFVVAGSGRQGFGGDGGRAVAASLNAPCGVAVDSTGNVYIADPVNNRIRKVTPAGVITTVAGNGIPGFSGDGGPATGTSLSFPQSVAVDGGGNLYIADALNNRVRKVNAANGIITTVAGNGFADYSGDGGSATAGSLNVPVGVAVDTTGDLYIADAGNNRIRKVTPAGTMTTIAGNGIGTSTGDGGPATSASLTAPAGVAVDNDGNVYIADPGNRIRKITPAGIITTIAGTGTPGFSGDGGPATSASIKGPAAVAIDGAGNLYIADYANKRIRKVSPAAVISTIAGGGGSTLGRSE